MTAKTEARDPAPGDLAALERVLERVRYLLPVQVDTKFQEFSGPECEDGFGRYAIDFDEREDGAGSEAEDLAALLNSVPDLIARARSAEAAEGRVKELEAFVDGWNSTARALYCHFHEQWAGMGAHHEEGSVAQEAHEWRERMGDKISAGRALLSTLNKEPHHAG